MQQRVHAGELGEARRRDGLPEARKRLAGQRIARVDRPAACFGRREAERVRRRRRGRLRGEHALRPNAEHRDRERKEGDACDTGDDVGHAEPARESAARRRKLRCRTLHGC